MSKSEVDQVTDETVGKGGLLVRLYFDMQSEKEEELQPLMVDMINNKLLKSPGVVYCFGAIDEPLKREDGYSTSAIVTALFKDIGALINITFNFAPAGMEVLKPEKEFKIKPAALQAVLLDISNISVAYSHYILSKVLNKEDYDKVLKDMKNREELGKKLIEKKEQ